MEVVTFRLGRHWIYPLLILLLDIYGVVEQTSARPKWPDPSTNFSVYDSDYLVANRFIENKTKPGGNITTFRGYETFKK